MRASACLVALLLAVAPLSAFAQASGGGGSGGGGGQSNPTVVSGGRGGPPPMDTLYRFQAEMFRQNLTRIATDADKRVLADRAMRVGAIVRTGDCAKAEALARGEGDAAMADRVVKLCVPGKGWSAEARRMARR